MHDRCHSSGEPKSLIERGLNFQANQQCPEKLDARCGVQARRGEFIQVVAVREKWTANWLTSGKTGHRSRARTKAAVKKAVSTRPLIRKENGIHQGLSSAGL